MCELQQHCMHTLRLHLVVFNLYVRMLNVLTYAAPVSNPNTFSFKFCCKKHTYLLGRHIIAQTQDSRVGSFSVKKTCCIEDGSSKLSGPATSKSSWI